MPVANPLGALLCDPSAKNGEALWHSGLGTRVVTRTNQTLYEADDNPAGVFVLLRGRAAWLTNDDEPRCLLRLRAPALMGDSCVVMNTDRYHHTAVCLEACDVVVLDSTQLAKIQRQAHVAWLRDMAMRHLLMIATAKREDMPVEERLWHWLYETYAEGGFLCPSDRELGRHLCTSADRIGRARRALVAAKHLRAQDNNRTRVEIPRSYWRTIHRLGTGPVAA